MWAQLVIACRWILQPSKACTSVYSAAAFQRTLLVLVQCGWSNVAVSPRLCPSMRAAYARDCGYLIVQHTLMQSPLVARQWRAFSNLGQIARSWPMWLVVRVRCLILRSCALCVSLESQAMAHIAEMPCIASLERVVSAAVLCVQLLATLFRAE